MIELPLGPAPLGRPLLPASRSPAEWHATLVDAITRHLGPAFAAILAAPRAGPGGITWHTEGTAVRRAADLAPAERQALVRAAGAILSEIRRLGESGVAPVVAEAWPALREPPGLDHLFAVDGRPVLAGWGFAPARAAASPLAQADDGRPWRAPPRVSWGVPLATLAGLAALALAAGLLLPVLGQTLFPGAPMCRAAPDALALLRDASAAADQGALLRQQLAQVQEDEGRRALACPLRQAAAAPIPAPVPAPHATTPPAAPPTDLGEDRWHRHDLAMLEGCWANTTQLGLFEEATRRNNTAVRWTMCFDRSGHGHQTIVLQDGRQCENGLTATFQPDDRVQLDSVGRCPFPRSPLLRGRLTCRHESDTEAACQYSDAEGPGAFQGSQPGRFHREQAR